IERVGNLNFPAEAINRNISGKLILNATLDHNGRVRDIQIDVSSGYNILDKAAMRIVKLASPYPPLPREVREKWDQLNITRTWIFHSGVLNTE
ncbi:MAG: energy transducer TonB, partial [Thiothrix sp.]|nr:energy transducer TonB [Thiothrix sp.]